jgi:hypothetical protein
MAANPVNESLKQAYRGSVSAIIQVLNDHLNAQGIRTRAIFDAGVLQILCEGSKPEELERSALVSQVKSVLEEISPRNIRRVNINARVIQEQQLLWLEEIKKDPGNQLLWSEEISLSRPNLMRHFFDGLRNKGTTDLPAYAPSSPSSQKKQASQQFNKGLIGGLIGAGLIGAIGFGAWKLLSPVPSEPIAATPANTTPSLLPKPTGVKKDDNFAAAVRLAEDAATATQKASSKADWQAIASKWQQASDLMAKVPTTSDKYSTAQDRTVRYRSNAQAALKKAT